METGFKELRVYKLAYKLAMDVFQISKKFPDVEKYALIDQIRRSSRSICTNLSEGYRKRIYPRHFVNKITDSDGECSETMVWLDFSRDCGYISDVHHSSLIKEYEEVGRMLGNMIKHPEKFVPRNEN